MDFFDKNLKYLREQRGLTQAEMLDFGGFTSTAWNNYEKRKSFPKFEDFLKISRLFEVDETTLIHVDLSKGNLNSKHADLKKGNLKGNPIGNLNTEEIPIYLPFGKDLSLSTSGSKNSKKEVRLKNVFETLTELAQELSAEMELKDRVENLEKEIAELKKPGKPG